MATKADERGREKIIELEPVDEPAETDRKPKAGATVVPYNPADFATINPTNEEGEDKK